MTAADAGLVAALHAASWRSAYRGILDDAYLDGPVDADLGDLWVTRLASPAPGASGCIAELESGAAGFAYAVADADAALGTLLDNLHVAPPARGGGIGRALLGVVARGVLARGGARGLFLHVYDANTRARAFYARHGARAVAREVRVGADGRALAAWTYAWDDVAALAGSASSAR